MDSGCTILHVVHTGIKKIIKHSKNLGLRAHVITCGDLVNIYDNIIVLEDDLFVSPYFYKYANDALNFIIKPNQLVEYHYTIINEIF